jgi:hypothetical protein
VQSPVPATSIHPNGNGGQAPKPCFGEVFTGHHSSNDSGKDHDFLLFATQERVLLEEGDNPLDEILSTPDDEHHRRI